MVCEGLTAQSERLPLALIRTNSGNCGSERRSFLPAFYSLTSRDFAPRGESVADLWGLSMGSSALWLPLEEDSIAGSETDHRHGLSGSTWHFSIWDFIVST